MTEKCSMCGGSVWDSSAERCPHCKSRRWNKDPFKGIADKVLLEEAVRRGLIDASLSATGVKAQYMKSLGNRANAIRYSITSLLDGIGKLES